MSTDSENWHKSVEGWGFSLHGNVDGQTLHISIPDLNNAVKMYGTVSECFFALQNTYSLFSGLVNRTHYLDRHCK